MEADRLARTLVDQLRKREPFVPLRFDGTVLSTDAAYLIQGHFVSHLKTADSCAVAGYKIGLTSPAMQDFCGVKEPITGQILDNRVHQDGAEIGTSAFVRLGIECELAVRIGKHPPVAGVKYDRTALQDCITSVHAAFEIIEDRGADYRKLDAGSIIAENSWNAGIVVAPGRPITDFSNLNELAGRLFQNDQQTDQGTTGDVMGDPLHAVSWLTGFLANRGETLKPGQWVMTGSIIPTQFPDPGDTLRFEIDGLLPVHITIT